MDFILRDDALTMSTAISGNMLQGLIKIIHGADTHLHAQPLSVPHIRITDLHKQVVGIITLKCFIGTTVSMELHAFWCHRCDKRRKVLQTMAVYQ